MPPGRASRASRRERRARVRRVVQDARRVDDVEGAGCQARALQIGLDELHALEAEARAPPRRRAERRARQVGADHDAIGARQIQTHLAGAAADLHDARVAGDRPIEQAGEGASLGPRAEAPAGCRAADSRETARARRSGAPSRCARRRAAAGWGCRRRRRSARRSRARPVRRERACARRAGEQLPEARPCAQKMA